MLLATSVPTLTSPALLIAHRSQIRRSAADILPSLLRCCVTAAERGKPGASAASVVEFLGMAWQPLLEALRKVGVG